MQMQIQIQQERWMFSFPLEGKTFERMVDHWVPPCAML